MEPVNDKNIQYERARKRVKEIKGFYIHALVYVLVNLFLIVSTSIKNTILLKRFSSKINSGNRTLGNWTFAHGLSVFLPNFILGKNWEEKKIRELMERNRNLKI